MNFTGERYIPEQGGQIKCEHWHRYAVSMPFAAGKQVLDVASGEGYGAAYLAQYADSVIGVDIDADTVNHAISAYEGIHNLTFVQGSASDLPLPDSSVDLVTSFETLEHHDQHERMMAEVVRVLRPNGLFIVSTPNRPEYTRLGTRTNHYHVKELDEAEFQTLLGDYFTHVSFCGQKVAAASFLVPVTPADSPTVTAYSNEGPLKLKTQLTVAGAPEYFLAVCSNAALPEELPGASIFTDSEDDVFNNVVSHMEARLSVATAELETIKSSRIWGLRNVWWKLRPKLHVALAAVVPLTALALLMRGNQKKANST